METVPARLDAAPASAPAAPATAATPAPPPAPRGLTRQDVFSALGALGAVLTLVTAVMFYFGWRRSYVQAQAMGIDVSLFGYSTQDYVLQSISSLYLPLLVIAGLGLAAVGVHSRVDELIRSGRLATGPVGARTRSGSRWTAAGGGAVAAGCLLFTLAAGLASPPPGVGWLAGRLRGDQWVVPAVLMIATATAAYAWSIARRLGPSRLAGDPAAGPWRGLAAAALVGGMLVLGGFWLLEEYASAVGRGYAQQLGDNVDRLSRAVVVSPTPLGIVAPGVREERLGTPDSSDVRYRTTGLRLLARSGGKVILVHDDWSPRSGTVIVLADRDDLSWQFSR